MIRRGITNASLKAVKPKDNITPVNIIKSKFVSANKVTKSNSYILQSDTEDNIIEEDNIKEVNIDSISYKRNEFMIIGIDFLDILATLTPKAFKLFNYIVKNIKLNYNYIDLSTLDISIAINDKYNSNISKSIKELITKNIIVKDDNYKNRYIINNNMFFKGNYNKFIHTHNKYYKSDD